MKIRESHHSDHSRISASYVDEQGKREALRAIHQKLANVFRGVHIFGTIDLPPGDYPGDPIRCTTGYVGLCWKVKT